MSPEETMNKLELEIEGMSCGHCVAAVSEALRELDGVSVDNVRIGSAEVSYEPAQVSPEQIVLAVEDAGYTAQPKA
jgi:copper chaperone CopZ